MRDSFKRMIKKGLSMFLVLLMVVALLPVSTTAASLKDRLKNLEVVELESETVELEPEEAEIELEPEIFELEEESVELELEAEPTKEPERAMRATGAIPLSDAEYDALPKAPELDQVARALPSSKDLTNLVPRPGDQGQQGSCVGWAVGYAYKSMQEKVERGWDLSTTNHQFSPSYIYNQLNGGKDNGINSSAAMNLIKQQGVCTLADMPYNQNSYTVQPNASQKAAAAQYKAASYGTLKKGNVDEAKQRLANGDCIVISLNVASNDFNNLNQNNRVYDQVPTGTGWHALCVIGYDDGLQAFKFINSWGTNWGLSGYGYLSYNLYRNTSVCRESYVMTDINGQNNNATLSLSATSWNPSNSAQSGAITVTTNQSSWSASSNASWLSTSKSGSTLTLSVSSNTSTSSRSGTVTVTAGNQSRTISVTQNGQASVNATLSLSATSWNPSNSAQSGAITVTTNQSSWSTSSNASWLSTSKSGSTLTLSVSSNTSTSSRSGTITVTAGNQSRTISVTQSGQASAATFSGGRLGFLPNQADINLDNVSGFSISQSYKNRDGNPWFDIFFVNGATAVNASAIKSSNNNVVQFRNYDNNIARFNIRGAGTAELTFTNKAGTQTYKKTVTVTGSSNATLSVSWTNWNASSSAQSASATVTTNQSSWSVSDNASWITTSKSGSTLTVSLASNTSTSSRSGTITVIAGNQSRSMSITQSGQASTQNGLQKVGNIWYYFENGVKITGWRTISGAQHYFFGTSGAAKGWMEISGNRVFFEDNGKLVTGWKSINNNWYYFQSNGYITTGGWKNIGGTWYYFQSDGRMTATA